VSNMGDILLKRPGFMVGKWYEDFESEQRFTLIYNLNCTAACSHCASESTPKAEGKVSLEDALNGCERILRDEFKDYPESALYMIGAIDEAKTSSQSEHAI